VLKLPVAAGYQDENSNVVPLLLLQRFSFTL